MTLRATLFILCVACVAGTFAGSPPCSEPPEVLGRVAPEFPEISRQARVEGRVELQVAVDGSGAVVEVHVLSTNRPNMGFEKHAIAAAQQWRFGSNERCEQREATLEFRFELTAPATERPYSVTIYPAPVLPKAKASTATATITVELDDRRPDIVLLLLNIQETRLGRTMRLNTDPRPRFKDFSGFTAVRPGRYVVSAITLGDDSWTTEPFDVAERDRVRIEPRSATRVRYLNPRE